MKNKALIITNIIILGCIIVGLLVFMFWGMNSKKNWFWSGDSKLINTYLYENSEINRLITKVKNYDIVLARSGDDKVKVEVYGSSNSKNNLIVTNKNGDLNIEQVGSNICFGFCYYDDKVIIYVPADYNNSIDFNSVSGDINILVNLLNDDVNIKTTSGDIDLRYVNIATIKSTSGSINLDEASSVNASTISGDISINEAYDIQLKTTSGDIEIVNLKRGGNITSISGDIEIDNFMINKDTFIESTSGEVDIGLNNEAYINVETRSGDRDIKSSRGEYELSIKTISGDVTVK